MADSHLISPAGANPRFAGFAPAKPAWPRFTLGAPVLDAVLGGGLSRGALHELYAAGEADAASAAGFALMLALRAGGRQGHLLWLRQARGSGRLHGPGLAELGADPARLLVVNLADARTLLKAAADVVRSPAAGTVVIAPALPAPRIDLTVTRRLLLAAERSGVTAILLRGWGAQLPSAAATRWLVAAAPSSALEAGAPGAPALALDLVRQRGGPPSTGWRLEWDRDAAGFVAAPLSGAPSADAGGGRLAAG